MRVLFVSGFNTHPEDHHGSDLYTAFDLYFRFSGDEVTFFRYRTSEHLNDVYKRFTDILDTKQHDLVICHSMGSCLAVKYIHLTGDKRRFILCMPYIHTSVYIKLLSKIPWVRHVHLPKCCIIPNHTLFYGGNILNDEMKLIGCGQVYSAVCDFFLTDNELVDLINTKDIHIIYATNEMVSPIEPHILSQIKTDRLSYSKGKHVSFGNVYNMSDFFEVLSNALKKGV
jgi:hypothetical protein